MYKTSKVTEFGEIKISLYCDFIEKKRYFSLYKRVKSHFIGIFIL